MEEDRKKLVEKSLRTNRILMRIGRIISIPYFILVSPVLVFMVIYMVLAFVTGFLYYTEGMSPDEIISFIISGDFSTTIMNDLFSNLS